MKYLVMEVHKAYCVVMDDSGKLFKVANMNYQLGQSLDNVILMQDVKTKAKFSLANYFTFPRLAFVTSLAFVCVFGFITLFNQPFTAYAQVYLTVNPQVKISVDKQNRVGNIEALNADGAKLIFDYGYKNKELTLVLDQLLDRAIEFGMLKEDGQVSIDIDTDDEKWFQDSGILLRDNLNQYLQDKVTVTIKIQNYKVPSVEIEDDYDDDIIDDSVDDDIDNNINDVYEKDEDDIENNNDNDDNDDELENNNIDINIISINDALNIAYQHAGVSSNIDLIDSYLDCEDKTSNDCKYEFEFESDNTKYSYEINAKDGTIMHFEKEIED